MVRSSMPLAHASLGEHFRWARMASTSWPPTLWTGLSELRGLEPIQAIGTLRTPRGADTDGLSKSEPR